MGKNTKVNKQLAAMFWLNWRKYGSVWYSLSCTKTQQIVLLLETKRETTHLASVTLIPENFEWDVLELSSLVRAAPFPAMYDENFAAPVLLLSCELHYVTDCLIDLLFYIGWEKTECAK